MLEFIHGLQDQVEGVVDGKVFPFHTGSFKSRISQGSPGLRHSSIVIMPDKWIDWDSQLLIGKIQEPQDG